MFHKYGIRDCFVRIERLNTEISKTKQLLSTQKMESVRKQVSWLPDKSSTEINSAAAISALGAYQNNVTPLSSGTITTNRTYISFFLVRLFRKIDQ